MLAQRIVKKGEMTSSISAVVRIWKICHQVLDVVSYEFYE